MTQRGTRKIEWEITEEVAKPFTTKLYCDGSRLPNRPASFGFVVVTSTSRKDDKPYSGIVPARFKQTNNVAEYMALIEGLKHVLKDVGTVIHVYMDSKLVVEQVNDRWRVKDHDLKELYQQATELITNFTDFKLEWIPRNDNIADFYSR